MARDPLTHLIRCVFCKCEHRNRLTLKRKREKDWTFETCPCASRVLTNHVYFFEKKDPLCIGDTIQNMIVICNFNFNYSFPKKVHLEKVFFSSPLNLNWNNTSRQRCLHREARRTSLFSVRTFKFCIVSATMFLLHLEGRFQIQTRSEHHLRGVMSPSGSSWVLSLP